MDTSRLDTLLHSLSEAPSRRGIGRAFAALTLSSGVATLAGLGGSEAKNKRKCKKRKKKKCPKLAFCTGKNSCISSEKFSCDAGDQLCLCMIAAETGEPFCGLLPFEGVGTCDACLGDLTCVYAAPECDPDPFGCALPCPNPL